MIVMEELLTPDEVAKKLKVSIFTVKEMLRTGEIYGLKVRGQWRIRPEDYMRYIETQSHRERDKK